MQFIFRQMSKILQGVHIRVLSEKNMLTKGIVERRYLISKTMHRVHICMYYITKISAYRIQCKKVTKNTW